MESAPTLETKSPTAPAGVVLSPEEIDLFDAEGTLRAIHQAYPLYLKWVAYADDIAAEWKRMGSGGGWDDPDFLRRKERAWEVYRYLDEWRDLLFTATSHVEDCRRAAKKAASKRRWGECQLASVSRRGVCVGIRETDCVLCVLCSRECSLNAAERWRAVTGPLRSNKSKMSLKSKTIDEGLGESRASAPARKGRG